MNWLAVLQKQSFTIYEPIYIKVELARGQLLYLTNHSILITTSHDL